MRRGHPAAGTRRPPLSVRRCPSASQPPGHGGVWGPGAGPARTRCSCRGRAGGIPPAAAAASPGRERWAPTGRGRPPGERGRLPRLGPALGAPALVPIAGGSGGRTPAAPNEGYRLPGWRSPAPLSRGEPCEIRDWRGKGLKADFNINSFGGEKERQKGGRCSGQSPRDSDDG